MLPTSPKDVSPTELVFRSINGSKLKLIDKSAKPRNVIKFVLHKDVHLNVNITLLLLFATAVLWKAFNIFIPFISCTLVLILQIIRFVTSVNKVTLTVVKFVGIYTERQRIFYGPSLCEFIPWDIVIDVFLNEVITGQKVLYYLTIITKDSIDGRNSIKLVPLFLNLMPERKCLEYMYEKLVGLIAPKRMKIWR
ncbi:hypothetical protein K0M31_014337 [Melipona bicolor]|uniref:Phosphatidylinositol N-acetylglucosaminyltransferase subunit H conserved domain-containing protein n=1 Tax=Melipona bicolor TaxID=60889 RepID=A0AA40G8L5_9HYME|nr:hypothetical protein K0M31_014337 [Melipona bicolor]